MLFKNSSITNQYNEMSQLGYRLHLKANSLSYKIKHKIYKNTCCELGSTNTCICIWFLKRIITILKIQCTEQIHSQSFAQPKTKLRCNRTFMCRKHLWSTRMAFRCFMNNFIFIKIFVCWTCLSDTEFILNSTPPQSNSACNEHPRCIV